MKVFFKQVIVVLVSLYILLVLLDLVYTQIYEKPIHARSKVAWLRNLEPNQQFDYALFGSSRVFFHLNPEQIKRETGLSGVNLGYPGSNNFEIKLMVKEFLKKQHSKKIFIQVDEQYNKEYSNVMAIIPWMPYIKEDLVYNEIKSVDSAAFFKRFVPFYRYMIYDSKLGFREMMLSFFKANKFESTNGFAPIIGQMRGDKSYRISIEDLKNKQLEDVIAICEKEKIELYFFTAPYYNTQFNAEVLQGQLPNYQDFSGEIPDRDCFNDFTHLNKKGAEKFTSLFGSTYFKN